MTFRSQIESDSFGEQILPPEKSDRHGIVIIGRNEASRLEATLSAVIPWIANLVYVDSNSNDNSPAIAEAMGVDVVRVTQGRMSAARGRRLGMEYLLQQNSDLEYIQFIDGDCELVANWIDTAKRCLVMMPDVGGVTGRLLERHQCDSLLLRLVAVDWDLPAGQTDVVGGISMMRVEALRRAGGWNDDLIAGEELDLSMRICAAGYTLQRLDCDMCLHDMGVTRFSEFWKRTIRTGFAYAQLAWLHGRSGPRRWITRTIGAVVYGLILPMIVLSGWIIHWSLSVVALTGILALILRLIQWRIRQRDPFRIAVAYAALITLCKTAQAIGAVRFFAGMLLGRTPKIIEYKLPANAKAS
jgi:glycosyltransferase involved in cell wall biosynthesis